ncbi:hypothetical protein B0T24DRAFT_633481 [Lasiosphaeria ovina]|uniref:Uncharacterized protein n=1 Tax=Lasiosphaeria ovina TaxID=92902 RepID=A0AAE0JYH9_9PEZI|nr:hypothetical protein B0T24DRAFT_633481 [Lasiosphaeria ovina]
MLWLLKPLEENVFICGVIYMSMCLGQYKLGQLSGNREDLERAQRVLRRREGNS